MAKSPATVLSIKQEVEKFEALQEKHIKHGAHDTEPDFIFQDLLYSLLEGEPKEVPTTVSGWQLYHQEGAAVAANELANQTKRILRMIGEVKVSDLAELRKYLTDVCWRI